MVRVQLEEMCLQAGAEFCEGTAERETLRREFGGLGGSIRGRKGSATPARV